MDINSDINNSAPSLNYKDYVVEKTRKLVNKSIELIPQLALGGLLIYIFETAVRDPKAPSLYENLKNTYNIIKTGQLFCEGSDCIHGYERFKQLQDEHEKVKKEFMDEVLAAKASADIAQKKEHDICMAKLADKVMDPVLRTFFENSICPNYSSLLKNEKILSNEFRDLIQLVK